MISKWPKTLFLLIFPLLVSAHSALAQNPDTTPFRLFKQAQSESDPLRKIELLDSALQDQTIKGDLLSQIFFERAMSYKALNDCYHAIEDLNSAMAHSKKPSPALLEKAHCLILLDQLDEASRVLETALNSRPGSARAYILKGMIYEKEGYWPKAHDEYTRALFFEPDSTKAMEMRANVLIKAGNPRKALEDLAVLIKTIKNNASALKTRARIHAKLKEFALAQADYAELEKLVPGDEQLVKERIGVYFNAGLPNKALSALTEHLRNNPNDLEAVTLQARAHLLLKNYPVSKKILKTVLSKDPDSSEGHLLEGMIAARERDFDQSLASLNRSIELNQSTSETYKERAKVFNELGDPVRAYMDLSAAAELDPSDGDVYAQRGFTQMHRLMYDAAIQDFSTALERIPNDVNVLYGRAIANFRKDDLSEAMKDVDSILKKKPESPRALSLKGVILFRSGKIDEAREEFDKSVKLGPGDPSIWNNRGFFLFKMGEHDRAKQDFAKALQVESGHEFAANNLYGLKEAMKATELLQQN
jgi:tetratricopeptide (TPR) repeat protein